MDWLARHLPAIAAAAIVSVAAAEGPAIEERSGIAIDGDFRVRLEADWDSKMSDGRARSDRTRLRARVRLGAHVHPTETVSVGLRLRSGANSSQQSPHITLLDFDGNDTGEADFNLDKWFVSYDNDRALVWVGRNSLPFWAQNELFWDADVTPAGVGATLRLPSIDVNLGYFSLPAGMRAFTGTLGLAQVVRSHEFGHGSLRLAAGVLGVEGSSDDDHASILLDDNGPRDYTTWIASVQYARRLVRREISLGLDILTNTEDYSDPDVDAFAAFHSDETHGLIISLDYGPPSSPPRSWRLGYYYADLETLTVSSSYTQDDWIRWGSSIQTRSTNFNGHELRLTHALASNVNLVARFYLVEANQLRTAQSVARENGKRFRVDLDYRF